MRKTITTSLLRLYVGSFPPITPDGNNWFGNLKRAFLAILIRLVNGRNWITAIEEIFDEYPVSRST